MDPTSKTTPQPARAAVSCSECGCSFEPIRRTAQFCSTACRKAFNNRRMTRGAELYDAFMALRYERKWAAACGLWQMLCRLASEWRAEDQAAGRASFHRPDQWVENNRAELRQAKLGRFEVGRR